jgi:hypothetical protein
MQAEFDLSPLFTGAPTPPREACPDPDERTDSDERRRRTRQVDAQAKALTLRCYPGTADMERFSARNDPSRMTRLGLRPLPLLRGATNPGEQRRTFFDPDQCSWLLAHLSGEGGPRVSFRRDSGDVPQP